jgi:hypothetical protein
LETVTVKFVVPSMMTALVYPNEVWIVGAVMAVKAT